MNHVFYLPRVKVVHRIGLCIALYDITRFGNSYLFPGAGSSHTKGWCVFGIDIFDSVDLHLFSIAYLMLDTVV